MQDDYSMLHLDSLYIVIHTDIIPIYTYNRREYIYIIIYIYTIYFLHINNSFTL